MCACVCVCVYECGRVGAWREHVRARSLRVHPSVKNQNAATLRRARSSTPKKRTAAWVIGNMQLQQGDQVTHRHTHTAHTHTARAHVRTRHSQRHVPEPPRVNMEAIMPSIVDQCVSGYHVQISLACVQCNG